MQLFEDLMSTATGMPQVCTFAQSLQSWKNLDSF